MKCGVIFNKCFAANLLENLIVKKCEHRLRINRVTAVSVVSPRATSCLNAGQELAWLSGYLVQDD